MNVTKKAKNEGFSLVEVLVGLAVVAIALLGLAQLFTYTVMANARAERMSSAVFLAQQQIDFHRNLTADELATLTAGPIDEQIDVNLDGTIDYRRVTEIRTTGAIWDIRVLVFAADQLNENVDALIQDPQAFKVKADMSTVISR
jgi:prepilin-type N-terminal cleavage/methylation domain-containing protein